jgi:predicted RNase H-like nuclease (RuvC/YqgF family)
MTPSTPEAYNRNLTARMIQAKFDAMKSEMMDEMSRLMMAQAEVRQPGLKESEERGRMADPERVSDLEKRLATAENKIRILERQKEALRKAIERQGQTLDRMNNASLAADRAQPVKNWIPVLQGQATTVVLSHLILSLHA